ncbi:ecdysteroid kinase domain-containing protein [Phthorimaea operculella]|nr:ecdysteroid kinase domain-containing protein [Phthorimaea operculella]
MVKKVDGIVSQIILVDFQICHYGCPANDILLLMYGCTDQKFRKAHKTRLINLYYQHLGEFLKYFDIEVSEVYPRKEFDRALKDRSDLGLMLALYYYAVYFAPDDDVPNITEGYSDIHYDLDESIVKRIEEIVEEYDEEDDLLKK